MLKKAGIVVAASAAALLAATPLAFATDHEGVDKDSAGIVSGANGNNLQAPLQGCNNDVMGTVAGGTVKDVTGALSGAASGLGDSHSKSQAADEDARSCVQGADTGDNR